MKRTACFFIISAVISASQLCAQKQIPGYLGKKKSAGYSTSVSVAGESSETTNGIGLVCSHNVTFEHCLSRKSLVEANFSFAPSKFRLPTYWNFTDQGATAPESIRYFQPEDLTRGYLASASVGIKLFRKQFIAPIGRFIRIRMGLSSFGPINWKKGIPGTFQIYQSYTGNMTSREGFLKTTNSRSTGFLMSFGFGKVIALSDKLMFEFANNININYSTDYGFSLFESIATSKSIDDFIFSYFHEGMKWRHLIDFQFGLKYNF